MAIVDGRKIIIRFTQPLVGGISDSDKTKFTVSFEQYDYVPGGGLSNVTREVTGIESYVSIDTNVDLNDAVHNGTVFVDGTLSLEIPSSENGTNKLYYNGVLLPAIPADVLAQYPYAWFLRNTGTGFYNLLLSTEKWYYESANTRLSGTSGSNSVWYQIQLESEDTVAEWTYKQDVVGAGKFTIADTRYVVWSNFDIPNDSPTSTSIYFSGSSALNEHVPSGISELSVGIGRKISTAKASYISWDAEVPEGTILNIYSKLSNGEYGLCENRGPILGVNTGTDLTSETLILKIEMSTSDPARTPSLSSIRIQIHDYSDENAIVLVFDPGNINSIQRAVGEITVTYDGTGTLMGQGGPVLAFEKTFTPVGLDPKNNPAQYDHLSVSSIVSTPRLIQIHYQNEALEEHVSIKNVIATCALTAVSDI